MPDSVRIGLPILFLIALPAAYCLSLLAPALIDEQYLLAWLKALPRLHSASGFSGFMSFAGLDPVDQWGITSRLGMVVLAVVLGKNIALWKFVLLVLHLTSTLLTYLCTKLLAHSRARAFLAASFFALYPLHFEAVAWVGGFGSSLATLFFLIALLFFLRGRSGVVPWQNVAIVGICMFLSITSSVIIWPACLAFAAVEFAYLLFPEEEKRRGDLSMTMIASLIPIVISGACLAACGGISPFAFPDFQQKYLLGLLKRLVLPVNEINWKHYAREYVYLYLLYPFVLAAFFCGAAQSRELKRTSLYALFLLALLALPLAGVALTKSNLYGERWLYAASFPLCLFLSCCVDGASQLKGKLRIPGIAGATILAVALLLFFFRHLWNENAANRNYARTLKYLQKCLKTKQEKEHPPVFIIADLPERLSVCPAYTPSGPVLIDPDNGLVRSNAVPAGRFKDLLKEPELSRCAFRYDSALKSLMKLDLGDDTRAALPEHLNAESFSGRMEPGAAFYKNVRLTKDGSELILESSSTDTGPVITIDPQELSTIDGDYLSVTAIINAPGIAVAPRVELYWQTRVHPHYDRNLRYSYAEAYVNDGKPHRYLLSLRGNGWTAGGVPTLVALGFPRNSRVRLLEAGLCRMEKGMMPRLLPAAQKFADPDHKHFTPPYFNYPLDPQLGLIPLSESAPALVCDYSAAEIEGATGVSVELSYPDRSFNDANSNHLSGQTYKTFSQKGQTGRIFVPITDLPGPGVYSLRVIARNARGAYLGQFSNELCYQVPRVRKEY